MIEIEKCENSTDWDAYVRENDGHPLQLWAWGEVKANETWTAQRLLFNRSGKHIGAAQVLRRNLPMPFGGLLYVPRGPVVAEESNREAVLVALAGWAKQKKAVAIKIEPNWVKSYDKSFHVNKWQQSKNPILLPRTLQVDISLPEEELLADMDAKTRQNVRRSLRYGVTARLAGEKDFTRVMEIYHETAKRAQFALHGDEYYEKIIEAFGGACRIYVAEQEGKIISFVWLVVTPDTAFELYGGMGETGRKLRANYALKWLTMLSEKERGTAHYDMNGLLSGGVADFKRGFAPDATEWVGSYDVPLSPLYSLWENGLPTGKKLAQKARRIVGH